MDFVANVLLGIGLYAIGSLITTFLVAGCFALSGAYLWRRC